jgi:hypothetical protein
LTAPAGAARLRAVNSRSPLVIAAALAAAFSVFVPALADTALRQLSDADLVAYAARPYDKAAMMERQVRLGLHQGLVVLVDFPCSDICPAYTTQIIHYELGPGPPCEAAGGVTQTREVPYSIAVIEKQFCVPSVLAARR